MSKAVKNYGLALANPRVAKALFRETPAWVWSSTGEQIIWANESGCRFFKTKSMPDLLSRTFRRISPATLQIANVAKNTRIDKTEKRTLRFLRGMNPVSIPSKLRHIVLENGENAVFVEATTSPYTASMDHPTQASMRFIKLFSRGEAAVAFMSNEGTVEQTSKDFQNWNIDSEFLKNEIRALGNNNTASIALPDGSGLLHLSAIRKKKGRLIRVFAVIEETLSNYQPVIPTGKPENAPDVMPDIAPDIISVATPAISSIIDEPDITTEAASLDTPIDNDNGKVEGVDGLSKDDATIPSFTFKTAEKPVRFLFEFDNNAMVQTFSEDFSQTLGHDTTSVDGQQWSDLTSRYALDVNGIIAKHLTGQMIWTETIHWPISETHNEETGHQLRASVTLTAMPVFNRNHLFEGFRGFGSIDTHKTAIHPDLDEWTPVVINDASDNNTDEDENQQPTRRELSSSNKNDDIVVWAEEDAAPDINENDPLTNDRQRTHENSTIVEFPDRDNSITSKVIPLHGRPVAVRDVTDDDEDTTLLSKPEQRAFRQIADALSARFEGEDEKTGHEATETTSDDALPDDKVTRHSTANNISDTIDLDAASAIEGFKRSDKRAIATSSKSKDLSDTDSKLENNDEKPKAKSSITSIAKGLGMGAAAILGAGAFSRENNKINNENSDTETHPLGIKDADQSSISQDQPLPDEETENLITDTGTRPTGPIPSTGSASHKAENEVLNRLPLGLIVSRNRDILFTNQAILDFLGYDDMAAFKKTGGINTLFKPEINANPGSFVGRDIFKHLVIQADEHEKPIAQAVRAKLSDGSTASVEVRLQSGIWQNEEALLMTVSTPMNTPCERLNEEEKISHLLGQSTDVMDIASDGIIIVDDAGNLIHANASSEALFGRDRREMRDLSFTSLFAEESQKSVRDYLDSLTRNGVASVLNDGREVIAREANGGLIPLFITIGHINNNDHHTNNIFCAVLRDITQWKRAEEELIESRRIAENANAQKSDFLAKVSHEIRTPLNAIIGFSEVMMEQHFGPMENPRYLEYARDIHTSGGHLVSLVNDLLDLSKIEAGKLDLTFSSVDLNPVIQECVALMQPDANRERIIIRTSLLENLPPIVADARSIRQIALNLLSNAVKFTEAGGQVIVSTTLDESGEVAIRVRDTGVGMNEEDLKRAMEPFRQVGAETHGRAIGTGLGLPLTKALTEANRARFNIDSRVDYGTLIQVIFPNERVLAQ